MPYLVFYRRGQELMRVSLDRPRVTVGRSSGADVVVPDSLVAPMQAAIVQEGGGYSLVDLSGKKTLVDGRAVERERLTDGVDVAIGSFQAAFHEALEDVAGAGSRVQTLVSGEEAAALPKEIFVLAQEVGGGPPLQVPLGAGLIIGSAAAVGLRLEHPTISGKHARITRQDGRLVLQDIGSKNGLWMNGMRLYEAELPLGVRFHVGPWDVWAAGSGVAAKVEGAEEFEGILSQDPGMRALFAQIDRVAQTNASVVVTGETGTGKELVARALHRRSKRCSAAFVPVNCGAIAHELMEAELFGHEKGAYTGAVSDRMGAMQEADGGTLFLDEIAELPRDLQPKLLRAVELGEIKPVGASRPGSADVRYVSATHRNLASEVRSHRFREDLFFRLAVATLQLPPLRQRRGDLPLLWDHFVGTLAPGQALKLTARAREKLEQHRWPGNVRELRNVVQRALLTAAGTEIAPENIVFDETGSNGAQADFIDPHGLTLEQIEATAIGAVLRQTRGNRRLTAKQLGIAKSTLLKKIADYGLKQEGLPEGANEADE